MGLPDVYGEDTETAQQVQAMLDIMPEGTRSSLDMHLRQAAKKELSKEAKEALADQAQNVSQRLTGLREQLEKQEQGCETPVTIEFYHCDHLGTPIALTDDKHEIVWAARLDPWGNVQEEFNPSGMHQDIRLPGQHHDRETGLYYNRHRYYDPGIGSYINQDPIGLAGGINQYGYPTDPFGWIDPLGLEGEAKKAGIGNKVYKTEEFGRQVGKTSKANAKLDENYGNLLDCIAVPTPPNCPTSAEGLEKLEKAADTSRKEAVGEIRDAYKAGLKVPGTLTGGPAIIRP